MLFGKICYIKFIKMEAIEVVCPSIMFGSYIMQPPTIGSSGGCFLLLEIWYNRLVRDTTNVQNKRGKAALALCFPILAI